MRRMPLKGWKTAAHTQMQEAIKPTLLKRQKQKSYQDVKPGDWVFVDTSRWDVKALRKFQPKFIGPFEVLDVDPSTVTVDFGDSRLNPQVNKQDCVLWDDKFVAMGPVAQVPALLPNKQYKAPMTYSEISHYEGLVDNITIDSIPLEKVLSVRVEQKEGEGRTRAVNRTTYLCRMRDGNERTYTFARLCRSKQGKKIVARPVVKYHLMHPDKPLFTAHEARSEKVEEVKKRLETHKVLTALKAISKKNKSPPTDQPFHAEEPDEEVAEELSDFLRTHPMFPHDEPPGEDKFTWRCIQHIDKVEKHKKHFVVTFTDYNEEQTSMDMDKLLNREKKAVHHKLQQWLKTPQATSMRNPVLRHIRDSLGLQLQ